MTHEQLVNELINEITEAYHRYLLKCNYYKFNHTSIDVETIEEHFSWVAAIQKYDRYVLEFHHDNLTLDSIADEKYVANYTNPFND